LALQLHVDGVMKLSLLILMGIALTACSQEDNVRAREQADRAREKAREAGEKLKVESKQALREAEVGAHKASREIDEGLEKARAKTRRALNQPDHSSSDDRSTDHR
jgi:1-aminocyclopropane-1-carboxylate deaminase/D-cysteine desulfhydrase-like pyridoxal-dependent ACC family enzyme